ncbi:MAG: tRNA pseudouridine(55) synthase TruB [bacterium]|nr:tRNA pseudouridine(55) synthase TruB [bacterium]
MELNGFILVDKPSGVTTYDCIRHIKKFISTKIGHAGTLDPFSTGVVVILLGKFTKHQSVFMALYKEYIGTALAGITTDTLDITGKVLYKKDCKIDKNILLDTSKTINGEIEIKIPLYSSKKINGVRMYKIARSGNLIDRPLKKVYVEEFEVSNIKDNSFDFYIKCSKGTYVRSVIELIGQKLDIPLVLKELRRISIGKFKVEDSIKLYDIKSIEDIVNNLLSA